MISIPREDLVLRGECVYCLSRFLSPGVVDDLIFLEDWTLDPQDSVILVDHNLLGSGTAYLHDRVSGVIDHHKVRGLS